MKEYYISTNGNIMFDVDFEDKVVNEVRAEFLIDYSFIIPEDGVVYIKNKNNDCTEEIKVKKNNLLLRLYSNSAIANNKKYIVVDSEVMCQYIEEYNKFRTEKVLSDCNSCCDLKSC